MGKVGRDDACLATWKFQEHPLTLKHVLTQQRTQENALTWLQLRG